MALETQILAQEVQRDGARPFDMQQSLARLGRQRSEAGGHDDPIDEYAVQFQISDDAFDVFRNSQNRMRPHQTSDVSIRTPEQARHTDPAGRKFGNRLQVRLGQPAQPDNQHGLHHIGV